MTVDVAAWGRIPEELRSLRRWCIAAPDKSPLFICGDFLQHAKTTDPSHWMDFNTAATKAWSLGYDIGFVLAAGDGYTCIDLDVKDVENAPDRPDKWTSRQVYDGYLNAIQNFDSYTEQSRSGKGFHIWLRAEIGPGARKDGVEIYSQERFIICTGKVVNHSPIKPDERNFLPGVLETLRSQQQVKKELEEIPPESDDWYVALQAVRASNSEKFCALWSGKWRELGFPSQSEADMALMSMFTFYSRSNSQCIRLFRASALGKREKATKNDKYLNNTLVTIRSREYKEKSIDVTQMIRSAEAALRARQEAAVISRENRFVPTLANPKSTGAVEGPTPPDVLAAMAQPVTAEAAEIGSDGLPWPPGFAGLLAREIYPMAAYPVKEVAIVAALGLLTGICGRAWYFSGSGLNQYITLVAMSGVGKDLMNTGISTIVQAVRPLCAQIDKFVMFDSPASGQALMKACSTRSSFVGIYNEWGQTLSQIAEDKQANLKTLKSSLLSLYTKSAPTAIVGGITYSNQENNLEQMDSVAYSMVSETTPSKFYESLTNDMMADGFLSRFLIIDYSGDRPAPNENVLMVPGKNVVDHIASLAHMAEQSITTNQFTLVNRSDEASAMLRQYRDLCNKNINGSKDESWRQMWNRAEFKMLRLAALLAVADNPVFPLVKPEHVEWAIRVVQDNIAIMVKRMEEGDIGEGDGTRERKLVALLRDYISDAPMSAGYRINPEMRSNHIVPRAYLQNRTRQLSVFSKHRQGANIAFTNALNNLVENGYIAEVSKDKILDGYGAMGKHYRILHLPADAAIKK